MKQKIKISDLEKLSFHFLTNSNLEDFIDDLYNYLSKNSSKIEEHVIYISGYRYVFKIKEIIQIDLTTYNNFIIEENSYILNDFYWHDKILSSLKKDKLIYESHHESSVLLGSITLISKTYEIKNFMIDCFQFKTKNMIHCDKLFMLIRKNDNY